MDLVIKIKLYLFLKNKLINIIDVGTHKSETIQLFSKILT